MGKHTMPPKKSERELRAERITNTLMEQCCGPKSEFAMMETNYQYEMIEAKGDPKELRRLQNAFLDKVEKEFPFAMSKKGVPSPGALEKRYDNDDYTIVSREDIQKTISKAVENALDALNETAKKMIGMLTQKVDDVYVYESVQPTSVPMGLIGGSGANEFNRLLIKELEAELGATLEKRGVKIRMKIAGNNEFSIELIPDRSLIARLEPTAFQKEREA